MKISLRSLYLILALSLFASSSALALPKVLICGAEQSSWIYDVKTKLAATGQFATVDTMILANGPSGYIPTLTQLQNYSAVLVFSDYGVASGVGSILASYVNNGGGVVLAVFAECADPVDASFNNSTYQVIVPGSYTEGTTLSLGNVEMPNHPIMKNVTSFSGGTGSWRGTSTTLNPSAYLIAQWSDNSTPLIAARENVGPKNVRRVDLNMFPPSSDIFASSWTSSTQGALIMANALTWVAGGGAPPSELNLQPRTLNFGTTPPGSPITYCVTANSIGAANLHITSYGISGANASDFSIVSAGKLAGDSILIGGNTQYCIQFQPTASGNRTATFTLVTDGRDSGTQSVTLTGNGQVPSVSYSTNSLFRGTDVLLTDTSGVQYLYVNSTGVGPLTITNVSFYGLNQQDYSITHRPQSAIPPGGVDSIGVRFAPDIEGLPDAHMVVQSNAINNPSDTVGLYGIGVLPHLSLTPVTLSSQVSNLNHTLVVNFDSVYLGTDSCMQVQLSNPGSDTLAIEKNYLSSKDFDFTLTPLTGAGDTLIPPGGSELMQVCFQPLQRGYRTATVVLKTNIPHTIPQNRTQTQQDTSSFAIQFIGTGVPSMKGVLVGFGPTSDTAIVGTQSCWTDTIKNIGAGPATIDSILIRNSAGFTSTFPLVGTLPTFPYTLQGDSILIFTICSTPTDTGIWTDPSNPLNTGNYAAWVISILSNVTPNNGNPFFPSFFVYGIRASDTILPMPFKVPCAPNSDTETVFVLNTGNLPGSYNASITGTNAADFKIVGADTSGTVPQSGEGSFKVVFTPSMNGAESATFNITGSSTGSVTLSAMGGAAAISGSAIDTTVVGRVDTFTLPITNAGTCDWTPGTVTVNPPFYYINGGQTNIPAGAIGDLVLAFAPTENGNFESAVTFTSSIGVSIPAASVSVTGIAAEADVQQVSQLNGFALGQSHPNPIGVGSEGAVEITVPSPAEIHLAIIDVKGEVVQTVLDRHFDAGTYSVTLDAGSLSSGTYYYQMTAPGGIVLTRQMTVVK